MTTTGKKGVLFVCLGNICRSPMAEAIFAEMVKTRGESEKWTQDSCGTGDFHIGKEPDLRAQKVMKAHGIPMNHKARVINEQDFSRFAFILGMDEFNVSQLKELAPGSCSARIELLGLYDSESKDSIIEDPYYDKGEEGFELVFIKCSKSIGHFLDKQKEEAKHQQQPPAK